MDTENCAKSVCRAPGHQEPSRVTAGAEMVPAHPSVEDAIRRGMRDAYDYAMPEGDQPALHRLAAAARTRGQPQIVIEEGLPLVVALPVALYRDLLAMLRPMAGPPHGDAAASLDDTRVAWGVRAVQRQSPGERETFGT